MQTIAAEFSMRGTPVAVQGHGNGHINETYRVTTDSGDAYILQRISTSVFHDPAALMNNIRLVTEHLAARSTSGRETLTLIPTKTGAPYAEHNGAYWRMYEFVKDSVCFDSATPEIFRESAVAFGSFVNKLSDFDASKLVETIPRFHDTPARVAALKSAAAADSAGRAASVKRELEAALRYEGFAHTLTDLAASGDLPLRVTHNDTKINNVLFDAKTLRGLCVVDLDTVMPGLIVNDFGDAIRFGASTAAEDEPDVSRVSLDLGLYEAYLSAYLGACGAALTDAEIALLPVGAKMMTYECGIRFLTDYLSGDSYFHTAYPEHNLHRARTQLKLVEDMDARWDDMRRILDRCAR